MKIVDNKSGSTYEYTEENGLISKDGVVVNGEQYEPVFTKGSEGKPQFCGIYMTTTNSFLSLSGNIKKLKDA